MRLKKLLQWLGLPLLNDGLPGPNEESPIKLYLPDRAEDHMDIKPNQNDGYLFYNEHGLSVRRDLPEGITRVGRLHSMDCVLNGPGINDKHAEFIRRDGRYYIRDISSNGETYIEGNRIPPGMVAELRPGDTVRLGNTLIQFNLRLPMTNFPHYSEKAKNQDVIEEYNRNPTKETINECKVIFLGDGATGKSSLIERIVNGGFKEGSLPTDGVKMIKL